MGTQEVERAGPGHPTQGGGRALGPTDSMCQSSSTVCCRTRCHNGSSILWVSSPPLQVQGQMCCPIHWENGAKVKAFHPYTYKHTHTQTNKNKSGMNNLFFIPHQNIIELIIVLFNLPKISLFKFKLLLP